MNVQGHIQNIINSVISYRSVWCLKNIDTNYDNKYNKYHDVFFELTHTHILKKKKQQNHTQLWYSFIKSYYITLYNHSHHSHHSHHNHHSHHKNHSHHSHHIAIIAMTHLWRTSSPGGIARSALVMWPGAWAWCHFSEMTQLNSKDCNTQQKTNIIQHHFTQQKKIKLVLSKNFITQLRILQHSPTWLRQKKQ